MNILYISVIIDFSNLIILRGGVRGGTDKKTRRVFYPLSLKDIVFKT